MGIMNFQYKTVTHFLIILAYVNIMNIEVKTKDTALFISKYLPSSGRFTIMF